MCLGNGTWSGLSKSENGTWSGTLWRGLPMPPPGHPRNIEPGMNSPFGCGGEPIPGPILPARAITYKHTQLYLSNAGVSPSWTNILCNLNKYIWQFGQIHLSCPILRAKAITNKPKSIFPLQVLPVRCTLPIFHTIMLRNAPGNLIWNSPFAGTA